jgi:hypothetical protein
MKLLNVMVLVLMAGGLVLSSVPCAAEAPVDESIVYNGEVAEAMPDAVAQVVSETEDAVVTTTGNRWMTDTGVILWEYNARIMATSGGEDTSWYQESAMTYSTGQSGFTAMVTGTTAMVKASCEAVCGVVIWTPKVLIAGVEYPVIGNPVVINDMKDNAYTNNVVKWDYGVCTRYLRVLDGSISEQFVFNVKPAGDISIDMGVDPSSTLEADIIYAVDASQSPLDITLTGGIKTVTLDAMAGAMFPITIDPSFTQFKTSDFDGTLSLTAVTRPWYTENFSVLWANQSATVKTTTLLTGWDYYADLYLGGYWCYFHPASCNESHLDLYRSYLQFNTSLLLWNADITAATLGMYATAVYNDNSSYHPPLGKVMAFRGIHNDSDELALPPMYPTAPIDAVWVPPIYWTPGHWHFFEQVLLSDFNQSKYVDTPIGISATNVTVNGTYYTMPFTAEGIRSINTNNLVVGPSGTNLLYSSFLVRIEREVDAIADWNGSDREHYFGGKQYVAWAAFEDGASQRPYLDVTYIFYAPPVVRTDVASQIGMQVARVNGYLEYDGASPCKVGLLVRPNGSTNYSVASSYYGDLDGDGWVTALDYTLLDAYLYTSGPLSPDQILRSDLNDDSLVDANDSVEMVLVRAGSYNNDRIYHLAGVTTGELFGKMITGLTAGATYDVQTVAWHEKFSTSGIERQFITIATLGDVYNFNADSECDTVSLTWVKANGSTSTMVRWKKYSAPTTTSDGTLLIDTTASYYQHTGLESGVGYYYSAWGVITGNYSTTPAEVTITTTACSGSGGDGGTGTGGDVVTVPNTSSWFNPPSSEGVKKIPGYAFINQMADAIGMPHGTWWFLLSMGFAIVVSMWVFYRSEQILLAFLTMCGLNVLFALIGTAPWWILLIFSISSLGFSWKELR